MSLKIRTNKRWRHFKYGYEVPEKVLKDQFAHLDEGETYDGFILYRKRWYHLSDYMVINNHPDSEFSSWDGYAGDSYFSGTLIRVSQDGESYQIATYFS